VTYLCDDQPNHELIVTFFSTALPSLIAENGDSVSFMTLQPSASGAKYQGRNELFWEHQGEALIVWGFEAPEIHCKPNS
jgi:membrane-bound inhibitor of C-type lysozyme